MSRMLMVILLLCAVLAAGSPAYAARPIVLLFETNAGEGANRELALSTTKALRTYFRETQKVEATVFDRESPAVTRAILEKRLTPDQVASYSSEKERVKVAEVIGFAYACGSEVGVKDGKVTVKLWLAKVGGGKGDRWEATSEAASLGTAQMDQDNAMQSAASAAVNNVASRAFVGLNQVAEPDASKIAETTALPSNRSPGAAAPTAADYVSEGDKSLKAGNLALAILQYSRAVDADPTNPALRIKLAEAYAARAMFDEAEHELGRAESSGADAETVSAVRKRIAALRAGYGITPTLPTEAEPTEPVKPTTSVVVSGPDPALAKIVEGDKAWNDGKPDEAADAYRQAAKLNPKEWRAWERIAIVSASLSLFSESRSALEQLKKTQPEPPKETVAARYEMLRKAFDKHFDSLVSYYDAIGQSFAKGTMSRENYYNEVTGLALRLEAMAKFVDALEVPAAKQPANLRRSLACGLMAQAASSLLDYLETNSKTSKNNASIFASQARTELTEAQKLESNTVIIAK